MIDPSEIDGNKIMNKLITEKTLGVRWDYSPATLRKWRVQGTGPAYIKLPTGGIRYDLETIEEDERTGLRLHTSDEEGRA
jgi:hypothetical protein